MYLLEQLRIHSIACDFVLNKQWHHITDKY